MQFVLGMVGRLFILKKSHTRGVAKDRNNIGRNYIDWRFGCFSNVTGSRLVLLKAHLQ